MVYRNVLFIDFKQLFHFRIVGERGIPFQFRGRCQRGRNSFGMFLINRRYCLRICCRLEKFFLQAPDDVKKQNSGA